MEMSKLYLKHRLVASPLGDTFLRLRHSLSKQRYVRHPELALLHEEDMMMRACVRRYLAQDAVCVDVGVHIGSITQLFRSAAPDGHHIMVEASPDKAEWLRRAFPDFTLHQMAVSDREGEVSFFEDLDNSGYNSLGNQSNSGRVREIVVHCSTLDHLLADVPQIDLIKIDVEGFEPQVVKGARDVLARCRPHVIFEAGAATNAANDNESYCALFRLFTEELEYDIRPIFGWYYDRPPITEVEFMACRIYPFTAFNFVAQPRA